MLEGKSISQNATFEKWLHQTVANAVSIALKNIRRDETVLLDEKEAAEFFCLRPQTLSLWRHQSKGPAYHKLGSSVRYDLQELKAFIKKHRVGSTDRVILPQM
jgi:hypothetical protein